MIESSHGQNLVCENDILIVDVVSDAEELTYDDWSKSIEEFLVTEGLWDILEDFSDEFTRAGTNEVAGAEDNEVVGVENDEVVRGDDNEVAGAENNEVAAGAGINEVAGAEDRDRKSVV